MAVIVFNEQAKPTLVPAFLGAAGDQLKELELGKIYLLNDQKTYMLTETITTPDALEDPWCRGRIVSAAMTGSSYWWLKGGQFQGKQHDPSYAWHVWRLATEDEIAKYVPHVEEQKSMKLVLGQKHVTKNGMKTTAVELYQVHNNLVGGPVFRCKLIKENGGFTVPHYYNTAGVYLGTQFGPDGNLVHYAGLPTNQRCLVGLAL